MRDGNFGREICSIKMKLKPKQYGGRSQVNVV